MKDIVVTGCSGFVGSALCKRLLNEGCAKSAPIGASTTSA